MVQAGSDRLPQLALALLGIKHRHDHLKGGHGDWPYNPLLVVVLLDHRGHDPGDADSITTHDHGMGFAPLVQEGGWASPRSSRKVAPRAWEYLTPEDLTHLDPSADGQGGSAASTGVAAGDPVKIEVPIHPKVPVGFSAHVVMIHLVGTYHR